MKFKSARHTAKKKRMKFKPPKKVKSKIIDMDENPEVVVEEPPKKTKGRPVSEETAPVSFKIEGGKFVAICGDEYAEDTVPWLALNRCAKKARLVNKKPKQVVLYLVDEGEEIEDVKNWYDNEEWVGTNKPKLVTLTWSNAQFGKSFTGRGRFNYNMTLFDLVRAKSVRMRESGEVVIEEIVKGVKKKKMKKKLRFKKR